MRMFVDPSDIYLHLDAVDFHKSINGLVVVVEQQLELSPLSDAMFIFSIKQAPVPTSIIPKGSATPSLLSQIITSKYQYGLPLYRQESLFKQYGIELSRKTMADWMIKSHLALQILYERLREILLQQSVIQADETTLKVIGEAKTTCYMWLYCCGTGQCYALQHD